MELNIKEKFQNFYVKNATILPSENLNTKDTY